MSGIVGSIIGILIGALFSGLVIWIVGRLGIGLEVDGFGPAYLAAIAIAVLEILIALIFGSMTGGNIWLAALVRLVVSALVLYAAAALIKGIRVKGFVGALVAALAIALVGLGVTWLMGLFV